MPWADPCYRLGQVDGDNREDGAQVSQSDGHAQSPSVRLNAHTGLPELIGYVPDRPPWTG